jgi:hypothetical protein
MRKTTIDQSYGKNHHGHAPRRQQEQHSAAPGLLPQHPYEDACIEVEEKYFDGSSGEQNSAHTDRGVRVVEQIAL